jgi:hypothetical protein
LFLCVRDTEHGGIRANADRKGKQDGQRERTAFPEETDSVAKIF